MEKCEKCGYIKLSAKEKSKEKRIDKEIKQLVQPTPKKKHRLLRLTYKE